jgi:hypothetical protein
MIQFFSKKEKVMQNMLVAFLAFVALPLAAQLHSNNVYINNTENKPAHLVINGNVNFSVKDMQIPFTLLPPGDFDYDEVAKYAFEQAIRNVTNHFLPPWVNLAPILDEAAIAQGTVNIISRPDPDPNSLKNRISIYDELEQVFLRLRETPVAYSRDFVFLSPVEANFKLYFTSLATPPTPQLNTIKVAYYSAEEEDVIEETLYQAAITSLPATPIEVTLPGGVGVVVTVKIAEVPGNNSGILTYAQIANPTDVEWTFVDIPVNYMLANLGDHLTTAGQNGYVEMEYDPSTTVIPAIIDGTASHSAMYPRVLHIPKITGNTNTTLKIIGAPTPEQEELLETVTITVHMDVDELPLLHTFENDMATFWFYRKDDYQTTVMY